LSKSTNKQAWQVRPNDIFVMKCKKVGVPVHPWSPTLVRLCQVVHFESNVRDQRREDARLD
jgi:hypothetical protein